MSKWSNNHDSQAEALIAQIKKRAGNLYQTRQLLCTENGFLHKMDTKIGAMMTRLFRFVCLKI